MELAYPQPVADQARVGSNGSRLDGCYVSQLEAAGRSVRTRGACVHASRTSAVDAASLT